MKTLGASSLKLFTSNQREKERVVWWSREIAFRQEIGFLEHEKRVRDGFSLVVSFKPKCVSSISAVSSAQTHVENEEIQTVCSDQPKTVHVRFKLCKECAFGQQFLIVGDDPILGLWDPSEGVPLNWSEGHVWTAEVDIPSGKLIKYKFILEGNTGSISWQPGPDRILETWETEKMISVSEDWDDPELQKIVEEDNVVAHVNEESLIDSDLLMVAENLSQTVVEEKDEAIKELVDANDDTNNSDKPSVTMVAQNITEKFEEKDLSSSDEGSDLMSVTDKTQEETMVAENITEELGEQDLSSSDEGSDLMSVTDKKQEETMVAENITEELGEQDLSSSVKVSGLMSVSDKKKEETNSRVANGSVSSSLKDATELVVDGVPVLVPGLVSAPVEEIEEVNQVENNIVQITTHSDEIDDSTKPEEVNQVENNIVENTTIDSDETEDSTKPKLKDEHVSASLHSTETREVMVDETQQIHGTERMESNVLESDMKWGRRALQKFLANLGFI